MLADVVAHLRCPHCTQPLHQTGGPLHCPTGHSFDVARQGYVSLLDGRGARGDTAAMVDARERFLAAGHFDPLSDALVEAAGSAAGLVVDIGAGTGWHLARVLGPGERPAPDGAMAAATDRAQPARVLSHGERGRPDRAAAVGTHRAPRTTRVGLALDSSKYALRRAARAHPRIGAVACDAWRPLPVRDDAAAAVLSVFAPRNPAEIARILHPDGVLIAVTPTPDHLAELVAALDLLTVDAGKPERLDVQLAPTLAPIDRCTLEWDLSLSRAEALAAAAMGPTAWHRDDLAEAAAALPEPFATRASMTISRYEHPARNR